MEEQLITFETAKLAKEKGFSGYFNCSQYVQYNTGEDGWKLMSFEDYCRLDEEIGIGDKIRLSAPTQSLLKKWLRENHDIHVSAFPVLKNRYFASVSIITDNGTNGIIKSPYDPKEAKNTYEEAFEVGLQEALNLI
jgi:hypothetical protein